MKLIAEIVKIEKTWQNSSIHLKLAKGLRYFGHENIITRHIGPRPWSEVFYVENGQVHLIYIK